MWRRAVRNSGHWLLEEARDHIIHKLAEVHNRQANSANQGGSPCTVCSAFAADFRGTAVNIANTGPGPVHPLQGIFLLDLPALVRIGERVLWDGPQVARANQFRETLGCSGLVLGKLVDCVSH